MQPILVIDDDDQARGLVRQALERAGYGVVEAADGEQGTRWIRDHPVSLVITDILMPNKEGLETIRELRSKRPGLPIIAISGGGQRLAPDSVLRVALMLGASRALYKPFALSELLEAVAALTPPSARPEEDA